MNRSITLLLLALVAAAGCIQPQPKADAANDTAVPDASATPPATPAAAPTMTGDVTGDKTSVAPCPSGSDQPSCATRTIDVQGAISGFDRLEVDLSASYGNAHLHAGPEGAWAIHTVLTARGGNDDEAKQQLNALTFTWSHTDGSSHFLHAAIGHAGSTKSSSSSMDVTVPASLLLVLTGKSSYGNLQVDGVKTDGLSVTSSYGNLALTAGVTQVQASVSYGNLEASLRPSASGRVHVDVKYGNAHLGLPEGAPQGYDLQADASYGRISLGLHEGSATGGADQYGTGDHRHFTTTGYANRTIETSVTLAVSYGNVDVTSG